MISDQNPDDLNVTTNNAHIWMYLFVIFVINIPIFYSNCYETTKFLKTMAWKTILGSFVRFCCYQIWIGVFLFYQNWNWIWIWFLQKMKSTREWILKICRFGFSYVYHLIVWKSVFEKHNEEFRLFFFGCLSFFWQIWINPEKKYRNLR